MGHLLDKSVVLELLQSQMKDLSRWLNSFGVVVECLKSTLFQPRVLCQRAHGEAAEPVFEQVGEYLLGELFNFRFWVAGCLEPTSKMRTSITTGDKRRKESQ